MSGLEDVGSGAEVELSPRACTFCCQFPWVVPGVDRCLDPVEVAVAAAATLWLMRGCGVKVVMRPPEGTVVDSVVPARPRPWRRAEISPYCAPSMAWISAGSALMDLSMSNPCFWCSTHRAGATISGSFVTCMSGEDVRLECNCKNTENLYPQPLWSGANGAERRNRACVRLEELLDVSSRDCSDALPFFAFCCFRRQELADSRTNIARALPVPDRLEMLGRCVGGTRPKNLLCPVEHDGPERRGEGRRRERLIVLDQKRTNVGQERCQLSLDVLDVEHRWNKESVEDDVARFREADLQAEIESIESRFGSARRGTSIVIVRRMCQDRQGSGANPIPEQAQKSRVKVCPSRIDDDALRVQLFHYLP